MPPLIRWFVNNPVASNLLMIVLLITGILSLLNTYREEFPEITVPVVNITIPYPGATPEEVEQAVCLRLEEAISGTPNVKAINSTAAEGQCKTNVELNHGIDNGKVVDALKSKVDSITSFPEDAEEPQIAETIVLMDVLQLILSGHADERSLKNQAEAIRQRLIDLDGVSQVTLKYVRDYEISIEVSEATLQRYNLTLSEVARVIQNNSIDLPGGNIHTAAGEILLRTADRAKTARDFERLIVLTRPDGSEVRLADIATVQDTFKEGDLSLSLDGRPGVVIDVRRVGSEDTIILEKKVQEELKLIRSELPDGIDLEVWRNEADDIISRLDLLRTNAAGGLFLVLIVLALFMQLRLAIWVAIGIPVALFGAVAFFPVFGVTMNTMSAIAMILVLGILVDDAVVVAERIYAAQARGMSPKEAAVYGTTEVSTPVIFGVLTTIAAFIPFAMMNQGIGIWFNTIGVVVILALIFSVVESQLILPQHLAKPLARVGKEPWLPTKLQEFAQNRYIPMLETAMRWRYLVMAIGTVFLMLCLALAVSGRMKFEFFPSVVGHRVYANLTMPAGTDVAAMQSKVAIIENAARTLQQELDADLSDDEPSRVVHIISSIGEGLGKGSISNTSKDGSHYAEVGLEVLDPLKYDVDPVAITARWREITGNIPGAVELVFDSAAYSLGKPIEIELRGRDLTALKETAARLKDALRGYPGIFDIGDSFRAGKQELKLALKPEARTLGLTATDLAHQVREAFYGIEVQRIQRGRDDMRVMVRYPKSERSSLSQLDEMMIRTSDGEEIPFRAVASVSAGRGYSTIRRKDGARIVKVYADVDRAVVTPNEIMSSLQTTVLPELLAQAPGVTWAVAGESKEMTNILGDLIRLLMVALVVMYALLAIPLKSYMQPLVIMGIIPFGVLGAILGHYIMGKSIIVFSLLGIVALSGVIINSSLVLVDCINRGRAEGLTVWDACIEAGSTRFRPIILTSFTTFVGLLPIMFNTDLNLLMFVPLAISLSFGILVATFINLLMLPALYLVMEDWFRLTSLIKKRLFG